MQDLRVYEFAKQMGIETIALMDKLREWDIAVKSHMATLDADTIQTIKEKMEAEQSSKKKKVTKKKKVAKKKTKKKKVVRTRKAAEVKAKESEEAQEEAAKKVVRRKKTAEDQEAVESTSSTDSKDTAEAPKQAVEESKEVKVPKKPKNIVGKIDLAKVEAYAKQKKAESRPSRPTTDSRSPASRNIPQDIPVEGPAGRKERGRKRLARNTGSDDSGPKMTPQEEENVSFNRTDFRKREAIFQPKKKKIGPSDGKKTEITKPKAIKRIVKVEGAMSVAELAKEIKVKPAQLIGHLMKEGVQARANDMLDFDTIALIVPEYDYEAENVELSLEDRLQEAAFGDLQAEPSSRPPVVTVMGHVDHGKTSVLDAIRKSDVAAGEAGGITQHIGAYQVKLEDGHLVTFLDTPGHEAFTEMRARGANVTDVAVIVIAADDGVMPQTAEAINHAKAAGVPIIIAMNKMDKQGANPEKIKQQVTEFELVPEEWGGSTMFIPTSATAGEGIKELLEAIHLQAEMLDIKANAKRSARGIVIEAKMEKGRGVVATFLVQEGTLKKGDEVVAGATYGRVRALMDDKGKQLKEAGPGTPVEILGLNNAPMAGDTFDACKTDKQAKEIAEVRQEKLKQEANIQPSSKMSLEDLFSKVQEGEVKDLPVILKTDVAGSAEAIKQLFQKVSTEKVNVKVIHNAVGAITESDVLLASSAGAILVGFNVRPDSGAQNAAKREGVQIKTYNIIYELGDDIRNAMKGLLQPDIVEEDLGIAEVRDTFKVPSVGTIAGCYVTKGKFSRDSFVRLVRDGKQIYEGKVDDLRRFKDSVKEVAEGYECGISIENYNDIKVGDFIEAYVKKEVEAEL